MRVLVTGANRGSVRQSLATWSPKVTQSGEHIEERQSQRACTAWNATSPMTLRSIAHSPT